MPHPRPALLAALLLAAAPPSLRAQIDDDGPAPRNLLSVGFTAGRSSGALREAVGDGVGGSFRSVRRLDRRGLLGLRVEGGALLHDHRSTAVDGAPGAETSTSNTFVFAGVGPQVQASGGPVRPYAHAFAGIHYLWTRTDQRGPGADDREVEITATHEDDAWAWGGGAGVYVPVRRGTMLDAGVTWRDGGEAVYLVHATGPVRGKTDLLVAHLGVTLEL
jgi:hypothetical protein